MFNCDAVEVEYCFSFNFLDYLLRLVYCVASLTCYGHRTDLLNSPFLNIAIGAMIKKPKLRGSDEGR